jgi:2-methylisocitrate lyase-like PEP mutase family enzyme
MKMQGKRMNTSELSRAANDVDAFRALHADGVLVLPNAWDAMSAVIVADAGAAAIATSSGGVSWSLGMADGERLTRDEAVNVARRIVRAVSIPVSVDIEAGYGATDLELASTVERFLNVGVCGVNIEDAPGSVSGLRSLDDQSHRIELVRSTANNVGVNLFINARSDVFLAGDKSLEHVIERSHRYAAAGADGLFVPGLADLDMIATLVSASTLPINIMTGVGGPSVAQLRDVGVRRVSVGTALARIAYSAANTAARELLSAGELLPRSEVLDGKTLNQLVS